jgi:hypothetical protein
MGVDLPYSYNGISRSWNVSNNIIYLKSIQEKLPNEIETLSEADRYNDIHDTCGQFKCFFRKNQN